MIKIESATLEEAYKDAASSLECSVTQLKIEVVQYPSKGFLGLFKKSAIIVAIKEEEKFNSSEKETSVKLDRVIKQEKQEKISKIKKQEIKQEIKEEPKRTKTFKVSQTIINDTIMPESFVSTQDEEYDDDIDSYLADYDDEYDDNNDLPSNQEIAKSVQKDINQLFKSICFDIDEIEVSVYDENTLLVEFKGEDAALLIGKEGYRYKALSYMIFNWINTKYQLQLRLEIAEFLKNQEESISRYLGGVKESVERDGRAQTKILDGVLVQIALRELREIYPDKYVAIRSTRDGLKYIIINDYHTS
ncbi:MAG: Jag N-terminal domain-containing protein [Sulfurimonas sp.]|uniref:Jag N-terminal domain-containing protein n=1 Tax=Sulfurimonas sp. TaxID=2022749 RepID=UPI0025F8FC1F|nr:Jag N-terminal domain-containing protein [Sulfurimonas sp.]MCK9491819.1 Jag N-terminal domain-containing protein [Sulfurimonas sp.]